MDNLDKFSVQEWRDEIARRIQELDSGKVKPISWADARGQISDLAANQNQSSS